MLETSPQSPEERRKHLAHMKARFGEQVVRRVRPGTRPFEILKRVALGVYNDGFIHAGNLAYLSLLSMFPFFISAAALLQLLGRPEDVAQTVGVILAQVPADVADVLRDPISEVLTARTGPLLWFGGLVGLWTATSFVETIRDILRRAYGVKYTAPFWEYRLISVAFIIGAVLLLMIAFAATVFMASLQRVITGVFPQFEDIASTIQIYRVIPALALFGTVYTIFVVLTPSRYRKKSCRKWPGALLVTVWWLGTAELLPEAISLAGGYDLTYGSLAGIMIALLFFFIIGLGVTMGAELNAALAEVEPTALEGEVYSGPFRDQLEVEEAAPDETEPKEREGGVEV
ncbi:YihY/virulence factor BrkB family protein [Sphingomonas arenae]|uniref:YihY/virulence factor BrkB family protein n=1 Tax=Sphingomonas arenae TaxID=2812555 RepID=UPI0019679E00|nr:YihY/virulence factor BrkB family protein [Sphingomonas arenae]